jgi:hypothetical protein
MNEDFDTDLGGMIAVQDADIQAVEIPDGMK